MEKKTVVLATYGGSRDHAHGDLMDMLKYELGITVLDTRGHAQIDMARSLLAGAALAHGADVMVFIDHDILFDPFDIDRLADVARDTRAIVGAPYAQRAMGASLVGSFDASVQEVTFFEGGGLYPTDGVIGMGFTAIHRDVLERLDRLPQYALRNCREGIVRPYFEKIVVDGYWLHEDASFCAAARRAGAQTFMDTRIRVKHLGDHPFAIEDCRRKSADEKSLKIRVARQSGDLPR